MRFMTAREARERMGEVDKTAVKIARKQFKEKKSVILRTIEIGLAEKKTEVKIGIWYPTFIFEEPKYSYEVYKEEFMNAVSSFLISRGYSLYFKMCKPPYLGDHWSDLHISWKENEE